MSNAVKLLKFGGRYFNESEIARKETRLDGRGLTVYYVWMKNGMHFSYLKK